MIKISVGTVAVRTFEHLDTSPSGLHKIGGLELGAGLIILFSLLRPSNIILSFAL